jgi:hypothetical protein
MSATEQTHGYVQDARLSPPSYVDRILRFFQGRAAPYWLVYLLLFFLQSLANHMLAWSTGWLPQWTFDRILLIYPVWQWMPLAIMTFLNRTALRAVTAFRPLLELDDAAVERLKNEFTSIPLRGVLFTNLFWAVFYLGVLVLYQDVYTMAGIDPVTKRITIVEGFLSFGIGGVMYFHCLRQLILIHRTVKQVKQFNLFALEPVYAFSRLTSWTGISWIVMLGFNFLFFPFVLAPSLMLSYMILMVAFALAAFLLPLRVVNQQLVHQKRLHLAEHQRRVETMLARLHHGLDQGNLAEIEGINEALAGLDAERKILYDIPTWPWRTATLTGFVSAAILPVILLAIQLIIERWFSR